MCWRYRSSWSCVYAILTASGEILEELDVVVRNSRWDGVEIYMSFEMWSTIFRCLDFEAGIVTLSRFSITTWKMDELQLTPSAYQGR